MCPESYRRIRILPHIEVVAGVNGKWIRIGAPFEEAGTGNVEWEMSDEGDRYVVTVELAGVAKKDIELYVSKRAMRLKAKPEKKLPWRPDLYRLAVTFGEEIDPDGVKARYENGVLTVEAPKKLGSKKIEIE